MELKMLRRKLRKMNRRAIKFAQAIEAAAVEPVEEAEPIKGGFAVLLIDSEGVDTLLYMDDPQFQDVLDSDGAELVAIPDEMTAEDLIGALNSGEKRLLKSTVKREGLAFRKVSK